MPASLLRGLKNETFFSLAFIIRLYRNFDLLRTPLPICDARDGSRNGRTNLYVPTNCRAITVQGLDIFAQRTQPCSFELLTIPQPI